MRNAAIPPGIPSNLGCVAGSLAAASKHSASQQVPIDSTSRIYAALLRTGASARYSFADASGTLLECTNFVSDPVESTTFMEGCVFEAPPVGLLTVTLYADAEDADLNYCLYFANGRRMEARVTPFISHPGISDTIVGKIVDANRVVLSGGTGEFSAIVHVPDGTTQLVALLDDGAHGDGAFGDGVFGGCYLPTKAGRYSALVRGTRSVGLEQVSRTADTSFVVTPTGASFAGAIIETPIDANGNGLYDSLTFEQGMSFTENRRYNVIGDLTDGHGIVIDILRWGFENTFGSTTRTVTLSVKGQELVRHSRSGPWTLTNIRIIRDDAGGLVVATEADYVTRAYDLNQFERPAAPRIIEVSPREGPWNGGTEILIFGAGLAETKQVLVGGESAELMLRDNHDMGIVIPPLAARPSAPREVEIKLITPWGQCVAPQKFVYTP